MQLSDITLLQEIMFLQQLAIYDYNFHKYIQNNFINNRLNTGNVRNIKTTLLHE